MNGATRLTWWQTQLRITASPLSAVKKKNVTTEVCTIICCAASNLTVYYMTENLVKDLDTKIG
jgi:hypothetical protein